MRRIALVSLLALMLPSLAQAAVTYVAMCNDGQRVQYNHTVGGPGLLYFRTPLTNGLQMAHLYQTSASRSQVCGAVTGNDSPGAAPPVSQLCIDLVHKTLYLLWHDPVHPATPVKNLGVFCKATVTTH